jgi:hypothetical protein
MWFQLERAMMVLCCEWRLVHHGSLHDHVHLCHERHHEGSLVHHVRELVELRLQRRRRLL